MNYLSVYAFVQIVGESLPLSSSGNVRVWTTVCNALGLLSLPSVPFCKNIDFLLHIPTLIILLIFFFKRWTAYLPWYACSWSLTTRIVLWTLVVDTITSFFYLLLAVHNKEVIPLWMGFLITAGFLYSTRTCTSSASEYSIFSFKKAIAFGLIQSIAVIPGISRFASTFAVARWYGHKPSDSLWYCFLIQIPLLVAAIALALYSCRSELTYETLMPIPVTLFVVACVSAYVLLALVARKADNCTFWHFSWYALGLAALAWYLGL